MRTSNHTEIYFILVQLNMALCTQLFHVYMHDMVTSLQH